MKNIFELASKLKLRVMGTKGNLSVEDLWDLSFEDLDVLAQQLDAQVNTSSKKSFVTREAKVDPTVKLRFDVVLSIIDTKLAQKKSRELAAERKAQREKLLELISSKEESALQRKGIASLRAELDKLDAEAIDGEE